MEANKAEEAAAKKKSGKYNCAQAIGSTFCAEAGVSEEDMQHIAQAFGVGMGTLEGTCGALIGAGLVLGMRNRDRNTTVRQMREIMHAFRDRNGTVTCKELKGVGGGCPLRQCEDCVRDAAEFLIEQLEKEKG
ncbi:MAG: C-GCAxxG-C-C family protein [Clostridiales bacterium]|nr:C-GCAxxG-C-C family protein [Clostridiales bacterium]